MMSGMTGDGWIFEMCKVLQSRIHTTEKLVGGIQNLESLKERNSKFQFLTQKKFEHSKFLIGFYSTSSKKILIPPEKRHRHHRQP